MQARTLQTWIVRRIAIRHRLERGGTSYLLFLMVVTTKHSLEEAARFSGLHTSPFSKMLKAPSKVAVYTLASLSKQQAKHVAQAWQKLKELPWKIAMVVDRTLQHRASLHPANAKTFNHGPGCVVGHQWTNIVWLLNDLPMPLRPIPFSRQRSCRAHALTYRTEHDLVVEYIQQLNLEDSIGSYDPREGVVLLLAYGNQLNVLYLLQQVFDRIVVISFIGINHRTIWKLIGIILQSINIAKAAMRQETCNRLSLVGHHQMDLQSIKNTVSRWRDNRENLYGSISLIAEYGYYHKQQ